MARMRKSKSYMFVKFPSEVIMKAHRVFLDCLPELERSSTMSILDISKDYEEWGFDTLDEFAAEYRKDDTCGCLFSMHFTKGRYFSVSVELPRLCIVTVDLDSRENIEKIFNIFEVSYIELRSSKQALEKNVRESIKIYIGHGRSIQWRDLKDHLSEKQGFEVVAYETGARAGYTVTEVLDDLSEEASIAFLVHTAEDQDAEGQLHARENVVHETGLFQGKLGWKRAIVLLENGCNEYTNLAGIQQLRFAKENIKEIFGDVMAIIYREFIEEQSED
jgi:predicted nucleotide-binding protein